MALLPGNKSGLTRQNGDHQQIGKLAGHADNEGAESFAPMIAYVSAKGVVAAQDGIRFLPDPEMLIGAEKRAGGLEFLPEERQPLFFGP